jgi:hypothetical protein
VLRRKKPQIIARFLFRQQALITIGVGLGQSKIIPHSVQQGKHCLQKGLGRARILTDTGRSAVFAAIT